MSSMWDLQYPVPSSAHSLADEQWRGVDLCCGSQEHSSNVLSDGYLRTLLYFIAEESFLAANYATAERHTQ